MLTSPFLDDQVTGLDGFETVSVVMEEIPTGMGARLLGPRGNLELGYFSVFVEDNAAFT